MESLVIAVPAVSPQKFTFTLNDADTGSYAYVADEANVYYCSVDRLTGLWSNCSQLSTPALSAPYSVAFPIKYCLISKIPNDF